MAWKATHRIRLIPDGDIDVMLYYNDGEDGSAYTQSEWDAEVSADFERVDGRWLFQGQTFNGVVERLQEDGHV